MSSKFFLRDSTIHGKKKVNLYSTFQNEKFNGTRVTDFWFFMIKAKSKYCNTTEKGNTNDCVHEGAPVKSQPPLIAKWRNGVKLQLPGRFDGDGEIIVYNFSFFIYLIWKKIIINVISEILSNRLIIIKREIFIESKITLFISIKYQNVER